MKMLFWGHIGNVHHPISDLHHLSPARSQGHAQAFADLGYDVTMSVFHKDGVGDIAPNLRRRHMFDLNPDDYDVLFLNFRLAITQLYSYSRGLEKRNKRIIAGKEEHFKRFLEHPNIAIQLDGPRKFVTDNDSAEDMRLAQHIKHIGISTDQGMVNWKRMGKTGNEFLCYAATIKYRPPIGADPLPQTGRPRVLYLGRLNDASQVPSIEKLEEVAQRLPHIDFVVVSCKVKDKTTGKLITPMLTDPDHITKEKVKLAKQQFVSPNIHFMPGPRYSDTFQYMYHADLGLGFAVRAGQDICSCKTIEYLGSGCPVVLEDAVPEACLLNEIDCGKTSKLHDFDDMASQIEDALATKYNRKDIQNHILTHHSYAPRAEQYRERFEK